MLRALSFLLCLAAGPLSAATSEVAQGNVATARLISAENGIGPGGETISAGLDVRLEDGWKTYWRSPGEVGLPPELNWEGSENIASVELAYPAPTRFVAFDIQNFGYGEEVVYPLTVRLEEPGAPARLSLSATLLVCEEICVPETLDLVLDLPAGGGLDAEAAARLADWIARVPGAGPEAGFALDTVHLDETALTVKARADVPFADPDIFPEQGDWASFGAPEITLAEGGRALHAVLPVIAPGQGDLALTLVDGDRAATLPATLAASPPPAPATGGGLAWTLLIAALGGLILNVMPCVLPVLSMKLAGALQARDRPLRQVRAGFLASVAGVLTFFVGLAGVIVALKAAGVSVGWGVQFQQPVFLALMIGLIVLFAASMFGWLAFGLSSDAMTRMARTEARGGLGGDFATGMFAAVMATPCSAPFLGTAVTYALTRGAVETFAVFAAMGAGLALPYLLVALRPALIRHLPRPGAWMRTVQYVLGGLLLLTAAWLVTVLAATAGWRVAGVVGGLGLGLLGTLAWRRGSWSLAATGLATVTAAALLLPVAERGPGAVDAGWEVFAMDRVTAEVAAGRVVFVDVTADWCLTCKANKRLVLDGETVSAALAQTVALQADWTRPDAAIAAYLQSNDRFGIPFNAVYGPGAPDGIVLPELLTEAAVLDALDRAGG
ncbi:protein-disulfide reductase DsbD family protein [Jannaschia marina]|uniref:protein-disulfide reductase DsbD family protein n=1 Tax=Jannaschia marina TaxID=2741674 RepID=UPI0015CB2E46|nr:protein-disulfide reductase DsbD domain-containing protein [Jannaschia marina]